MSSSYISVRFLYSAAMIIVSIREQMLHHRRRTGVWYSYPISTAANGAGNREGSFNTPLGRHRIAEKIGDGMPLFTAFKARQPVGIFDPATCDGSGDWILTRILWLSGIETGKNRRGCVDTKHRYIYIHGTHDEAAIGTPCSHGCIRMRNLDMLDLFEHVQAGESVNIRA